MSTATPPHPEEGDRSAGPEPVPHRADRPDGETLAEKIRRYRHAGPASPGPTAGRPKPG